MTITLAQNAARVSYSVSEGATQTSFTVSFEFFDAADLNVYVDGTLKTISTHYTVSGGSGSTGAVAISVTGASGGSTVVITRSIALARTTDFPSSGSFQIATLNTELDRFTAIAADLKDSADRALILSDSDSSVSTTLPLLASRKGTVLGFNASTGAVEAGPSITAVQTLSAASASINLLGTAAVVADLNILATDAIVADMAILATSAIVADMAILATDAIVADMAILATSDIVADMAILGTDAIVADMALLGTSAVVEDMGLLATAAVIEDMGQLADSTVLSNIATLASDNSPSVSAITIGGASQLNGTLTVGVDDTGHDVKLFGDTASAHILWDASADKLLTAGGATVDIVKDKLLIGGTAVTTTAAELNTLDALSRGSILYGNASAATTVLTKGSADTVLTSDGTDISWAAAAGGPAYTRATTPPSSPSAGDWWIHTAQGNVLYIYDGTLGWLTNTDRTFGQGFYMPANTFSVVFTGALARVSFEGVAIGETSSAFATVTNVSAVGSGGSWALSNSSRGVFAGVDGVQDHMDYITMGSDAASVDFGNLTVARTAKPQGASHATRGVIAGGNDGSYSNVMDYITIASAGNATDFGNLTVARDRMPSQAMSSTTRSIFHGGYVGGGTPYSNVMDYITVASAANATDFGDTTAIFYNGAGANSTTRGISAHGFNRTQVIDYVTIGTTGNASDFGDLLAEEPQMRIAIHNETTAYLNSNEQITIATAANSTASGYAMGSQSNLASVMPGWIAANG